MGIASAVSICGGTFLGMTLSRILPIHHLSTESKDTIKMVSGIIATLSALVVSLLIASAKTTYDTINSEVVQASAKYILLNDELRQYGPETKEVRETLLAAITAGVNKIWGTESNKISGTEVLEQGTGLMRIQSMLSKYNPQTEEQRQLLGQIRQQISSLMQTRWLVIEEAQGSLPPNLYVVLLVWLGMLFTGIGLFAPPNGTVLCAIFGASLSLSIAIFLIEEMNRPLDGMIKVPSAPMLKVIQKLSAPG